MSTETVTRNECSKCHSEMQCVDCWNCGGEGCFDLYEDDPLWYDEDDVEDCEICEGMGFYYVCGHCHPVLKQGSTKVEDIADRISGKYTRDRVERAIEQLRELL